MTTLYTRPDCSFCALAKRLLEMSGEEFEEIDVSSTPGAEEELVRLTGGDAAVPVLVESTGEVRVGFGGA
jgi:glutaredoxin